MDRSQSIRLERARQQYEHLLIHAGQMVLDNDKFLSPSTGILQSSYQKQDAHDSYRSKSDNDNNNSINRYSHNSNRNNNTDHSYLIDSSSSLYPPQPPILSQYIKSSSDYSNQPLDKSNTHTFAQSITSTPYYNSTHSNNKNNSSQLNHHKNNSISSYTHIHSPSYLNEQLNSQYGNNINYNNHNHISTNKTLPPMSSSDKDEVIISLQDQIVKLNHELNSTIEKANKTINSDHELVEKLKEEYAGAEDELYHKNIALTNAIENVSYNNIINIIYYLLFIFSYLLVNKEFRNNEIRNKNGKRTFKKSSSLYR